MKFLKKLRIFFSLKCKYYNYCEYMRKDLIVCKGNCPSEYCGKYKEYEKKQD